MTLRRFPVNQDFKIETPLPVAEVMMDLVMTALAQRHEIKKNGTYFVAFTLNTATTTYYGITRLTSSTSSTSTALAATASAVKAAYDRNSWDSISLTNALAVAYGGTGATTAAGARANFGIGVTQLYFGTLTTGGTSFNYGNYNFYIILGQPWSSGSLTPIVVPKIALTTGTIAYQFTDESYCDLRGRVYPALLSFMEEK